LRGQIEKILSIGKSIKIIRFLEKQGFKSAEMNEARDKEQTSKIVEDFYTTYLKLVDECHAPNA